MISLVDCIGFCGLTEEEVFAVAEHERIHPIAATALVQHLLSQTDGCETIRGMILEDIRWAFERGDERHCKELRVMLRHFVELHPKLTQAI
jgi:hypothetical protein